MPLYGGSSSISANTIWDAKGDLLVGTGADTAALLPAGTDGQFLTLDSGEATGTKWATLTGGGDALVGDPLSQFAATTSAELAGVISDETGTDLLVFNTSPTIFTPEFNGQIVFEDDVRQTFAPGVTNAGLNVGSVAGDPSSPSNGDLWYDSVSNELTGRINGVNVTLGSSGGGDALVADPLSQFAATTSSQLAGVISDETGSGPLVFGTSPTLENPVITGAIDFEDDVRQTFNPGSTNAGLNVGELAVDPSSPGNGDLWYNSSSNDLMAHINGVSVSIANESGSVDNLLLPLTTDTAGQIKWNGVAGIHTYGTSNFFAGASSGNFALTGSGNVGIGYSTLSELTTGSNNVAIGGGSQDLVTSGSGNTSVGVASLGFNSTGTLNAAFGQNALALNTGSSNTAIGGDLSLSANTTGQSNSAVGYESLPDNTTGSQNTGVGVRAGEGITTGGNNTFLGYFSTAASGELTNATAIGYESLVSSSDTLVLGNLSTGVVIGATATNECALLTMTSTTRGLLPPRMTDGQRDAISSPVNGLVVYNTDTDVLNCYQGGIWGRLGDVSGPASATDHAVARFDSTTGKLIQDSVVTIADETGDISGVGTLNTHTIPGGTGTIALTSDVPVAITVADTDDATCFVGLFESETGDLAPKTDSGLTYDATTASLTATEFVGSLTGNADTATTLGTARAIYGNDFDGSAALTQIIESVYGGTGNGFAKFSGPATSEKTFTLPDASCTILTTNDKVTYSQIQDVASNKLLGMDDFGPGPPIEIPCGEFGRGFLNSADAAAARENSLFLGTIAVEDVGVSGEFLSGDDPQKTITVTNGIITGISS